MKEITQQRLKEFFTYSQGNLYWKIGRGNNKVGGLAGALHPSGYRFIGVDSGTYSAHRLIFLMHMGYLPKFLDHKYGKDIGDYLWNLRECTHRQNMQNRKINTNNKSGIKGVSWNKVAKSWNAQIRTKNRKNFGYYEDLELAELVADEVREKYHGKFANHG